MPTDADAVVIGAGLAGSAMAYAMAKKGWDVVLLDKLTFPKHKACGEFLSPEAQTTLRALGLDSAIRSLHPADMTKVRIHTEHGSTLEIPLPGLALGMSRFALDNQLQASARAEGAALLEGCSVYAAEPIEDGYRVEYGCQPSEKLTIRSRIVIGAGGRRMSGGGFRQSASATHDRAYVGIKSHYTRSDHSPIVDLYFFRGGYIGIAPVEGERLNVAAIVLRSAYPKLHAAATIERILEKAIRRIPALEARLAGTAPIPGTQAAAFPVAISGAPRAWSHMPLIGDAAAVIPPFCGDGMAMALRSAELCAPLADAYLRGDIRMAEWRDSYTRQLHEQFSSALQWGRRLERVMSRPGLSSLLLRIGSFAPGMAERIVRATRLQID
ncbi:NAD(P)/FAD-dependent oxidoreductase [Cohnella lubricantis]|uniref:NAD(P)/FAD-dependent oxidoreductase n=1 Tax=Cohnella lubricantis TaxID=2163172 RepID=A0A841TCW0_9BACL|nr:NAD(P)/FAD-dependent oxidoreductase [Cohnella lubricantis]MBB6677839.1 NAD(P)/FAD-dependent oxidoreductase [Cohnella lubricantis]MBP2119018.1 flavin-dependent dehydrogenase [Cohnella lubricantis]